jgi:flagellar export protein FliJ
MFRFEFEAILTLRETERDVARAALAASIAQLIAVQTQREELQRTKSEVVSAYRDTRIGLIRIDSLREQGNFEKQMAVEDAALAVLQGDLEAEMENRQADLVLAEIEYRRWDSLRKQGQHAWAARCAKLEQQEMDEVSARRSPRVNWP